MEIKCDESFAVPDTVEDLDIGNGKSCRSNFIELGIHQISSYFPEPLSSTPSKQWPSETCHKQLNCKSKQIDLSTSYVL